MEKKMKEENRVTMCDKCDASVFTEKRTYTVDEIQNILGVGLSTAYKLVKERQFHSVKVGHRVLISRKSFDLWLDSAS